MRRKKIQSESIWGASRRKNPESRESWGTSISNRGTSLLGGLERQDFGRLGELKESLTCQQKGEAREEFGFLFLINASIIVS